MSHEAILKNSIRDIDVLLETCEELGLKVAQDRAPRGYRRSEKCPHVIILPEGVYADIGVRPKGEEWELTCSFDSDRRRKVEAIVGAGFGKIKQVYAARKLTREAKRKGKRVKRTTLENGKIQLVIGA